MSETRTSTAKPHGGEGASRSDWPATETAGAVREIAQQGTAFAGDIADKTRATAQETNKILGKTYSAVAKGAADFNREWIDMVRANTNATFDFAHQLLGVKSPSEFLELSAAHARKQFESFAEQAQHLTGIAQKVTSDAAEPFQAGMKSALTKAA